MSRGVNIWMVVAALLVNSTCLSAQDRLSAQLYGGFVDNVALPLMVRQTGYRDLSFPANYQSRSLERPPYYGCRISRWINGKSWELEFIHHKIYLSNNPPEITYFNISHGLNMFLINRGMIISGFEFHGGAGLVIAHPEFMIRNVSFDQTRGLFHWGYMPNGLALNLGVAHPFSLTDHLFINVEARTTFAYIRLAQDDMSVDACNLAFHLILGPGLLTNLGND